MPTSSAGSSTDTPTEPKLPSGAVGFVSDPSSQYFGQPIYKRATGGYDITGYNFAGGYRGDLGIGRNEAPPTYSTTAPTGKNDYGSGYSYLPSTPNPQVTQPMASPQGTVMVNGAPYDAKYAPGASSGTSPSVPTQSVPTQPQNAPKPAPAAPQPQQSIDYTFNPQKETVAQYNQRIATAQRARDAGMGAQQAQTPTAQQPAQPTQSSLAMPANGSVVDLLNMAGQDSSFAARQQLAQQFGIQGYTGTAAQNTTLAQKYLEAHNTQKGAAPQSGAEARTAIQSALDTQNQGTDALASFYDSFGSMDPITASLFQQIAQIDSDLVNRPTYAQILNDEMTKSGVAPLKEDLAQTIADIRLTEDQVREELSGGGGLVLESQVRGVAAARTKILLTKAEQLSNIISAKEEAVDRIVQMTQMDRAEVDAQMDRKLGLTKMLYDMQSKMQDRARENYQNIIKDVGYDGLVDSISSQQELQQVASALGMSPQTLMQLSTVKTSAQRQMEIEEMSFQLSVDKFNEDKRQFGMQYALEQQKLANQTNANSIVSPYTKERTTRNIDAITSLYPKVSSKTVGLGSYGAYIPGTEARNFDAEVNSLKANIAFSELTAMREASKTGGALGAISDRELSLLTSSLGALDTGQSPAAFKKSLDTVKDNIYRWNAQALSVGNGYDYQGLKNEGYSDEEIYNYFK